MVCFILSSLVGKLPCSLVECACADSFNSSSGWCYVTCSGAILFLGRQCDHIRYTGSCWYYVIVLLVMNIDYICLFLLHGSSRWEAVVYRAIHLGRWRVC